MASFSFDLNVVRRANGYLSLKGRIFFNDTYLPVLALKHPQQFSQPRQLLKQFPHPWDKFQPLFQFGLPSGDELLFDAAKLSLLKQFFETIKEKKKKPASHLLPPSSFQAILRPYQLEGFRWLSQIGKEGGILADDMGLGKTVEVLALLTHEHTQAMKNSSLLILPKSLLFNWKAELRKFSPYLSYREFVDRERNFAQLKLESKPSNIQAKLMITTYGILTREIERLGQIPWHWVILDEAHVIKNPNSKVHQAVLKLKSHRRLSITGTPIENRLQDLWSQFHFLSPTLFGPLAVFRKHFVDGQKEGTSEMASEICAPFFLRRRKEAVLKDLPEKTESEIQIPLEGYEKKFYQSLRAQIKIEIERSLKEGNLKKSRAAILRGLLRLRQAALDPRLIPSDEWREDLLPHRKKISGPSSKLKFLLERLSLLREERHSVLVFSQFTSMLDLMQACLKQQKFEYQRLDGKIKDRKKIVAAFNESSSCVFLLSLKVGGVGLNLTKASYVFHFDPWWNPAIETQATDRAHRYGQKNAVFSYKLIAKDTVEERVLCLQKEKKHLYDKYLCGNKIDEHVGKELVEALLV